MNDNLNSHRKILIYILKRIFSSFKTFLRLYKGLYKSKNLSLLESPEFKTKTFFVDNAKEFFEFRNQNFDQENSFFINKNTKIKKGDDVVILAVYCNEDKLSKLQKKIIKSYKIEGFKVLLVVACSDINFYNLEIENDCDIELIRNNMGYDFGSWSTAISVFNNLSNANTISLTNDSVCLVNYDLRRLSLLKSKIKNSRNDIVFLTENKEIFQHNQSYFFTFKESALRKGILDYFKYDPPTIYKSDIILKAEVGMNHFFLDNGFTTDTLYRYPEYSNNILIYNWRRLIKESFPFIKLKLFEKNLIDVNDSQIKNILTDELRNDIVLHLQSRGKLDKKTIYKNFKNYIIEQEINYPPYFVHRPISINIKNLNSAKSEKINFICILHAYYSDLGIDHIRRLISLNIPFKLIVTTNTNEKKNKIINFCLKNSLDVEVNIHKNKGRDILPFLKELKKIKDKSLPILHIHTKKSPHEKALKDWGEDSLSNLIYDQNNVLSIIEIFKKTNIGIIYPEFPNIIKNRINWGYNFKTASSILNQCNIYINLNDFLLFPAGSMMWLKFDAIKQVINYANDDLFQEESGQEDGTTAHAIERIFFFLCKENGFEYLPIKKPFLKKAGLQKKTETMQVPTFKKLSHLIEYCKRYISPEFKRAIKGFLPENNNNITYPVIFKKNNNVDNRANLIIPTLEPDKIYGGISTALRLFKRIINDNNFDQIRIIVTTDLVSLRAVNYINKYFESNFVISSFKENNKKNSFTILPIKTMFDRVIDIQEHDKYVASAWWTADLGFRIIDQQEKYFQNNYKLIYFIQDYEPIFYPNSSTSALAKSTYQSGGKTIAVINSEELYNFFIQRFNFHASYYVPFELNENLKKELCNTAESSDRENIIICYGRPSTPRNCFELINKGLILWQQTDKRTHVNSWKIYFIGEKFDSSLINNINNSKVLNKLSLEKYAALMKRASIGISLMESPHPSYPPIEMALFGVKVITNIYESKDLSKRSKNIYNLSKMNEYGISNSLKILTREKNNNLPKSLLDSPECKGKVFEAKKL